MPNESDQDNGRKSFLDSLSKSLSQKNDQKMSKRPWSFLRKSRSEAPTRSTSPLPSTASAEHPPREIPSPFGTAQDEQEQSLEIPDQTDSQAVPGPAAAVTLSSGH
ncbi:hypothetical protein H0H93_002637, partial [Arthromyces matolae]